MPQLNEFGFNYDPNYPLDRVLEAMKPCRVRSDNPSHMRGLRAALKSDDYVLEKKIDGCHYLNLEGRFFSLRISDVTEQPVEKTDRMPHLQAALHTLRMPKLILDGEVWIPGGKSQDVITVTGCLPDAAVAQQKRTNKWLRYVVFDVLRDAEGNWLVDQPWYKRRLYLQTLSQRLGQASDGYISVISIYQQNKEARLAGWLRQGLEGGVLKHKFKKYETGKRPMWNWIKVKQETEDDVVILGFEPPERIYTGKDVNGWMFWEVEPGYDPEDPASPRVPVTEYHFRGWIGKAIIGKYDSHGNLVRLGTVSGMERSVRLDMTKNPHKYIGQTCKVQAMEITRAGAFRHPSFVMMRPDKNPHDCRLGEV